MNMGFQVTKMSKNTSFFDPCFTPGDKLKFAYPFHRPSSGDKHLVEQMDENTEAATIHVYLEIL